MTRSLLALLAATLLLTAGFSHTHAHAQDEPVTTRIAWDRMAVTLPGKWTTSEPSADVHGATSADHPGIEIAIFRAIDPDGRELADYHQSLLTALEKDHKPLRGHAAPQPIYSTDGTPGLGQYRVTTQPDGRTRHLFLITLAVGAHFQAVALAAHSDDAAARMLRHVVPAFATATAALPQWTRVPAGSDDASERRQQVRLFNCTLDLPASWTLLDRKGLQGINWLTAEVQLPRGTT
ncbi:MAG: hypothetical protein AB7S36_14270 [Planctomycetota bacterium]